MKSRQKKQASEGISLAAQEARIKTWCDTNDYELVRVYVDAGVSGKRMDRKELLAALTALKDLILMQCCKASYFFLVNVKPFYMLL